MTKVDNNFEPAVLSLELSYQLSTMASATGLIPAARVAIHLHTCD
jgi:hypothetical protein